MELVFAVLSEPATLLIGRLCKTRYGYILNCNRICPINQDGQPDRVHTQIVLPPCSPGYLNSIYPRLAPRVPVPSRCAQALILSEISPIKNRVSGQHLGEFVTPLQ